SLGEFVLCEEALDAPVVRGWFGRERKGELGQIDRRELDQGGQEGGQKAQALLAQADVGREVGLQEREQLRIVWHRPGRWRLRGSVEHFQDTLCGWASLVLASTIIKNCRVL